MQESFSKLKTNYETIKISHYTVLSILKENTELPIAKNLTKPSNPTELPHCRKHFEVRRCRVSVLNITYNILVARMWYTKRERRRNSKVVSLRALLHRLNFLGVS